MGKRERREKENTASLRGAVPSAQRLRRHRRPLALEQPAAAAAEQKAQRRGKEAIISADDSKVTVWVIPTNEELMIAQDTAELVKAAK